MVKRWNTFSFHLVLGEYLIQFSNSNFEFSSTAGYTFSSYEALLDNKKIVSRC